MKEINVGIIDDDKTKRTQIISCLESGVDSASEDVQEMYQDYILKPIELNISGNIDYIIEQMIDFNIDALLIDYQLTSFESVVDYTGVEVAKKADKKYLGFPVFILTSFETELYKHEIFDPTKVFDFERYIGETKEQTELNRKIFEQYLMRKKDIEKKKRELYDLLPNEGKSQAINDKIIELDTFIERSLDGEAAISECSKKRLLCEENDEILELLRKIVQKEEI